MDAIPQKHLGGIHMSVYTIRHKSFNGTWGISLF